MTRDYAAQRLLEHGPLSTAEFQQITGWPPKEAYAILNHLKRWGRVACVNHQRCTVWRLI